VLAASRPIAKAVNQAAPGQKDSRWSRLPGGGNGHLRLTGQPIFYPVLNEEYAAKIARDWNVRQSGAGCNVEPTAGGSQSGIV